MTYLSVCSGIEAATVAWHPLGFTPAAFAEIERFPSAVLKHHYPDVPNRGDMTKFKDWPDADIDLLVGGTPCQSYSVAGLRAGLADPRGSLMLTYLAIAGRYRPKWLVWENVPGVLSSDDGEAFGSLLGGLAELGYGFAYRILDAQYFRLAQRRRRVFVVGHLGDWRRAAAVLFERASLSGHLAPSHETRQEVAGPIGAGSTRSGGRVGRREAAAGHIVPALSACGGAARKHGHGWGQQELANGYAIPVAFGGNNQSGPIDVATAVNAHGGSHGRLDFESKTFITHGPVAFSMKDHGADCGDISPTLRAGGHAVSHANGGCMPAVAFDARQSDVIQYGDKTGPLDTDGHTMAIAFQESQSGFRATDAHPTLDSNNGSRRHHGALVGAQVRRLTPRECERLQGFPDNYTLIPYRGKVAKDGPRYKALGNSMAVPCMAWIGRRIQMVEQIA